MIFPYSIRRKAKQIWRYLSFVFYLFCAWQLKCLLIHYGFKLPAFATWEIAAMAHVFTLAWEMIDFNGFLYVSRTFNARVKKFIVVAIGVLFFAKATAIFFETQHVSMPGKAELPLVEFSYNVNTPMRTFVHIVSPSLMMAPVIMFAVVNVTVLFWVKYQSAKLNLKNTGQEKYLKRIFTRVDLPPLIAFVVPCIVFMLEPVGQERVIVGVLSCSGLTLSNFLAALFVTDEKMIY